MLVSQSNCHPFRRGQFVFMHNGGIGGFSQIRRNLLSSFNDDVFRSIRGSTDSEHAFALFLSQFQQEDVVGPEAAPNMIPAGQLKRLTPEEFARGLRWTIIKLMEYQKASGLTYSQAASSLNFAVSDGQCICVSRCRTHPTQDPPTLYYAKQKKCPENKSGSSSSDENDRDGGCTGSSGNDEPKDVFNAVKQGVFGDLAIKCSKQKARSPSDPRNKSTSNHHNTKTNHVHLRGCSDHPSCVISSEPLDYVKGKWELIPKDHMLLVHGSTFTILPLRLPKWEDIGTVECTPCIRPMDSKLEQDMNQEDSDFSLGESAAIGSSSRSSNRVQPVDGRRTSNRVQPPLKLKIGISRFSPSKSGGQKRGHVGVFSAGFPVSPRTQKDSRKTNTLEREGNNPTANRLRRMSEQSRRKQQEEHRWQQSLRRTLLSSVLVGSACLVVGTVVGWICGSATHGDGSEKREATTDMQTL